MNEEYVRIHEEFKRKVNWLKDKPTTKRGWTCIINLDTINRVQYAIVLAWMDYDNNGDWRLYGKVAYKSIFSLMDEYDIDWTMPYQKDTKDVVFDEMEVTNVSTDFDLLYRQWWVTRFLINENYDKIEFGQKTRKVEV